MSQAVDAAFYSPPLLTLVDEHHLDHGVERDVDLVRAHAVGSAVGRLVVAVAELVRADVLDLR